MSSGQTKKVVSFEDFQVFEKAYAISLEIHKASLGFPKIEQYALADQIRKASKSVCANIAEGYGKQKQFPQEFKRFLCIALGSSDETRVWIRYCKDLAYVNNATAQRWRSEYIQISKMLQALLNSLR